MSPNPNRDPKYRIPTGIHVHDRDVENMTRMIVVNHPSEQTGEFQVAGTGKTVADYNEDYSADAAVVQVVYQWKLSKELPDWKSIKIEDLWEEVQDTELKVYSYPAPRMKSVTSVVPKTIKTHRELICYQSARLVHLSVTIDPTNSFAENLMWGNYDKRLSGDIELSSILKENKYQMKENIGLCMYCGKESKTTFDHVIPMDNGGDSEMGNMVPVCPSCNSSKSNKNVIDWHKKHDIPVDRVVLGKYLKLLWEEFKQEGKLDEPISETLHDRWDGVEITRNISQTLYTDARLKQ
ncbi:HNH endonuclease [Natrialbaceae archaeon A-CW2]|uniref:HNH endonuclease n=1 Tax=Natronoglomus mannanivorans TaxID=2979990 RepID=A0AAP3E4D8_9EURY|nr:HNH endonuclease [Halobacteria archaeon AArc-xg1-1]